MVKNGENVCVIINIRLENLDYIFIIIGGINLIQPIPKEQLDKIIKILSERGAVLPCPRCGNNSFNIVDGFFNHSIQTDFSGMVIGGPSLPCAIIVCTNCGFLSQHALGTLGVLPEKGGK